MSYRTLQYGSFLPLTGVGEFGYIWEIKLIDAMKNLYLTLITCLLLTFVGCEKEVQTKITLDATTLSLKVGERHQFRVTNGDMVYTVEEFSWTSSDMSIGNINGSGQVHAGKAGNATITATHYKDKSIALTCAITVVP